MTPELLPTRAEIEQENWSDFCSMVGLQGKYETFQLYIYSFTRYIRIHSNQT